EGEHIRRQGREFEKGHLIFSRGRWISPPMAGMLASLGYETVKVHPKPKVSVVITGDEIAAPGEPLTPGRVRDANSFSLCAALKAMNLRAVKVLYARDRTDEVKRCFEQSLEEADMVISTGGVSVGRYDLVKEVLLQLGAEEIFWRVAMKPGKPNYFGRRGSTLIFGLPGNTVSCMVSFHLFARPALQWMQGWKGAFPKIVHARLRDELTKNDPRTEWVRGSMQIDEAGDSWVKPLRGRGSHMLGHLALADCLIRFPGEKSRIDAGQRVDLLPLSWSNQ
ncbi:MAG: molybdopterin molybdotransferase MoeA, partial [Planctomycetes bacterium]|nr:molybdopterin molybdotransferase MoeA [Planctomycetota bacterium]